MDGRNDPKAEPLAPERSAARAFTGAMARLSEDAFRKIWDNPDDAAYDDL
jgi:hypothetical protein